MEQSFSESLSQLASQLNLDSYSTIHAENYYKEFKNKDNTWEDSKSNSILRVAMLAAAKTNFSQSGENSRQSSVTLSKLLQGPPAIDLQTFMLRLREFSDTVHIQEPAKTEITWISNNFAFSLMFFKKYEEFWKKLVGERIDIEVKDMGWLLFIISRINLLQRRTDMKECANMLVAVIFTILLQFDGADCPSLADLCDQIGSKIEHTSISVKHFNMMLDRLKHRETIRGNSIDSKDFSGIFLPAHIMYNLKNLAREYEQKLFPDDVDEREFLHKATELGSPFPPYAKQISINARSNKGLPWDENVTLNSKLHDLKFPHMVSNSPYAMQSMTPMSKLAVTEAASSWIETYVSKENVKKTEYVKKRQTSQIFNDIAEEINALAFEPLISRMDSLKLLYINCLDEIIGNEDKRIQKYEAEEKDISPLCDNSTFHKSIIACCMEAILFTVENTLTIEDIMRLTKIQSFELWKIIKQFYSFDPRMPADLKHHFRIIETKIVSYLAWTSDSAVNTVIKSHIKGDTTEISHPSFELFFRKVLSQTSYQIYSITEALTITDQDKEDIWTVMKSLLSEKTELLVNRHLDQLILCTIYAVCKAKHCANITFNSIIGKYSEIQSEENERIFRHVKLDEEGKVGDIIKFYNEVYIQQMKNHVEGFERMVDRPRIATLNPNTALSANFPQPLLQYSSPQRQSPILARPLTPGSITPRKMYAFGESPSHTLDGINSMIQYSDRNDRKIDFDADERRFSNPSKKSRSAAIFDDSGQQDFDMPDINK